MNTPHARASHSAMQPEHPEHYLPDLVRPGRPWARTRTRRVMFVCAVAALLAIAFFLAQSARKTTVHGDLIMINSGAKDTIDCNNGNVKLDGDNNTYTITGHCRRLEVFGGANHVTVDSTDTISVFGDDNAVIYHSGAPTINKTGNNNIVSQRSVRAAGYER